jgi:hypothetical protein
VIKNLDYWPAADEVIAYLESQPKLADILAAVNSTIARLAADPFDRRLGTIPFMTEEYGGINATPVRLDNWYIFWQRGPTPATLDIVLVEQLDVGREL